MEPIDLSKDDDLFTDYAMQLFMAYMQEGKPLVEEYMKSIQDDFVDNETFTPGLVFGMLMHMMLMVKVISSITEASIKDTLNLYALEYNDNRNYFANFPTNHPKFAQALLKEITDKLEKE